MRTKSVLIVLGSTLLLVVGVLVYAVNRIEPADVLRLAADRVKTQTGRDLKVDGRIGLSFSLEPRISLEGVRLQNAAWGSRPDMLLIKRVDVGIALLPLLSGQVKIRGLTLIEPDLLLETNAEGVGNWVFAESGASSGTTQEGSAAHLIDVDHAEIEQGVLEFRAAGEKAGKRLELSRLQAKTSGAKTTIAATGRLNAQTIDIDAKLDRSTSPANLEVAAKAPGASLAATTALPTAAADAAAMSARVRVGIDDWQVLARLLGTEPVSLPPLKAQGQLQSTNSVLTVEGLQATLGKSNFSGSVRVDRSGNTPRFDVAIDAPSIDLAELQGPSSKEASKDGRIFSAEPLPVAALRTLDGKLRARIARLTLRDGKALDGVDVQATAAQGRIAADPVSVRVEGRELRMTANLDATSGTTLGAVIALKGSGISLGALGALMNLSGTPEGSPTDLDIRFSSRGDSVRTLMAGANADVRIVVGPGRLRNRAIDWGADVTELLDALNPVRKSEAYTELKCAVVRLPIRQGVARIDNSIAAETSKVTVIAAGVIDLRNETLDLGFRPKAATGLGVGLGGLASLGRLRGTLTHPKVELDMSGTAQAAAQLGLAAATGGLSLLAGGLLSDSVPDNACQAALTGAVSRASTKRTPEVPAVVDSLVGGIKKLFGR